MCTAPDYCCTCWQKEVETCRPPEEGSRSLNYFFCTCSVAINYFLLSVKQVCLIYGLFWHPGITSTFQSGFQYKWYCLFCWFTKEVDPDGPSFKAGAFLFCQLYSIVLTYRLLIFSKKCTNINSTVCDHNLCWQRENNMTVSSLQTSIPLKKLLGNERKSLLRRSHVVLPSHIQN